ncbi:MAG: hypothetical protein BWY91_02986 [bacterium ADurb.BinA028]|nr:MAG: hypothetical protein BWY91_02986 [bacterium ADurb.BinA028]
MSVTFAMTGSLTAAAATGAAAYAADSATGAAAGAGAAAAVGSGSPALPRTHPATWRRVGKSRSFIVSSRSTL